MTPEGEDSLARTMRQVHGRFAQYWNVPACQSGHLGGPLLLLPGGWAAVDRVIRYVEMNPARAGISGQAGSYQWSSAEAHLTGTDRHELLDMAWWGGRWQAEEWRVFLGGEHQEEVSAYHISEKQPRRRAAPGYYK